MNNKKWILLEKYSTYIGLLLLLYVLQATPGLFRLWGNKPLFILPIVMCIAMHEGEFSGGILGAVGGMLCDLSSFTYFGYHAMLFLIFAVITGLLIEYLMRCTMLNAILLCFVALLALNSISFFFLYGLWAYQDMGQIYLTQTLPTTVYSTAFVPIFYYSIHKLSARYQRKLGA